MAHVLLCAVLRGAGYVSHGTIDLLMFWCCCCCYSQANKLVKEIQISMWGNIYVEEVYEVVSECKGRIA